MADTEISQHPSTMAPPGTWLRLLWENGGVAPAYWGKVARILLVTTLASPLRFAEWLRYGRQVAQTEIDKQPLFILGFARSGTTHLHNLLQHDPQYGTVSTFQAVVPTFFLIGRGWLKRQMAKAVPATRPGDNVRASLDAPIEEEVAVSNTCTLSPIHHLSFPQRTRTYWDKYLTMQGLTQQELARWERVYLNVLRKATLDNDGSASGSEEPKQYRPDSASAPPLPRGEIYPYRPQSVRCVPLNVASVSGDLASVSAPEDASGRHGRAYSALL